MEVQKVFDKSGVWLMNKGNYAFVDPTTGCRFDPRTPTQAIENAWVKNQDMIERVAQVKVAAPEVLVEKLPAKSAK